MPSVSTMLFISQKINFLRRGGKGLSPAVCKLPRCSKIRACSSLQLAGLLRTCLLRVLPAGAFPPNFTESTWLTPARRTRARDAQRATDSGMKARARWSYMYMNPGLAPKKCFFSLVHTSSQIFSVGPLPAWLNTALNTTTFVLTTLQSRNPYHALLHASRARVPGPSAQCRVRVPRRRAGAKREHAHHQRSEGDRGNK